MKLLPLLGCAALLCATAAMAETGSNAVTATPPASTQSKPLTAQQQRMQTCSADASTQHLKGAERKSYMKACLSGKPVQPALNAQQQRMKDCSAKAGEQKLKGAERKKFMSSCLKGE